jgi:hypothetical protein
MTVLDDILEHARLGTVIRFVGAERNPLTSGTTDPTAIREQYVTHRGARIEGRVGGDFWVLLYAEAGTGDTETAPDLSPAVEPPSTEPPLDSPPGPAPALGPEPESAPTPEPETPTAEAAPPEQPQAGGEPPEPEAEPRAPTPSPDVEPEPLMAEEPPAAASDPEDEGEPDVWAGHGPLRAPGPGRSGYVLLHRVILDHPVFSLSPYTLKLFVYFLCRANWREARWRGITIPRGALITSYQSIADACTDGSIKRARTAFAHLEQYGIAAYERAHDYTLVKVCNYDRYQVPVDGAGKPMGKPKAGQAKGKGGARQGHTKGRAGATGEDGLKQGRHSKTGKTHPPPTPSGEERGIAAEKCGTEANTHPVLKAEIVDLVKSVEPVDPKEERFECWWTLFVRAGKPLNEQDKQKARRVWNRKDTAEQDRIFKYTADQMEHVWSDAKHTAMPLSLLEGAGWTRVAAPRLIRSPNRRKSKGKIAMDTFYEEDQERVKAGKPSLFNWDNYSETNDS